LPRLAAAAAAAAAAEFEFPVFPVEPPDPGGLAIPPGTSRPPACNTTTTAHRQSKGCYEEDW